MHGSIQRVFSTGFRFFFLAAGLYAVFTGMVWFIWLGVHATGGMVSDTSYAMAPHHWHAHEMIFGYATAAIAGFLLTAVPNWTNAPAARGLFVAMVATIWMLGRVAVWYSGALPAGAVAAVDLAFLPVLMLKILMQLMKRPKPQNMMFLLFLGLAWSGNLLVHLEWMGVSDDSVETGLRLGLVVLCALISVLGGRVTPAFTRNAMKRAGLGEQNWPVSLPWQERMSLGLALTLPLLVLASSALFVPDWVLGGTAILFGSVQAMRLLRWRAGWARQFPILIALHAGLAMLALGMVAWGLSLLGWGSEIAALHLLGIGCVGGMTMAVMSRAALGHSGRPLVAPDAVAMGYALIALTAVLRWLGSTLSVGWYFPIMLLVAILWMLAFALYLIAMWPALTGPRQQN